MWHVCWQSGNAVCTQTQNRKFLWMEDNENWFVFKAAPSSVRRNCTYIWLRWVGTPQFMDEEAKASRLVVSSYPRVHKEYKSIFRQFLMKRANISTLTTQSEVTQTFSNSSSFALSWNRAPSLQFTIPPAATYAMLLEQDRRKKNSNINSSRLLNYEQYQKLLPKSSKSMACLWSKISNRLP